MMAKARFKELETYTHLTGIERELFEALKETREALERILDAQNGPPLERHRDKWQAAVDEGWRVLGRGI